MRERGGEGEREGEGEGEGEKTGKAPGTVFGLRALLKGPTGPCIYLPLSYPTDLSAPLFPCDVKAMSTREPIREGGHHNDMRV